MNIAIDKKDFNLIILGSLGVFLVIVMGIVYSTSILKEETIENKLSISKLNAKFLSEDLNQHMNHMELFIENIASIINFSEENSVTNKKLQNSLGNFPIIRSINIIYNHKIINSSNTLNIGLKIDDNNFFPKPLFSDNIVRVSSPWSGRDFNSGSYISSKKENHNDSLSFIPMLKKTYIDKRKHTLIVTLNTDFILNRFNTIAKTMGEEIELSRIDNLLLLSNNEKKNIYTKKEFTKLLTLAIKLDDTTGIQKKDNIKMISSYSLLKDYPFIIGVHLDYEKSLLSWNQKSYKFFIISIGIITVCIITTLIFILLYRKEKEKEILAQKLQLEDHEKFKHLFNDSHFITAVIDKYGKVQDINSSALEFLNIQKEKVININFWDLNCWGNREKRSINQLFSNINKRIDIKQEINVIDKFNKDAVLDFSIYTINQNSKDYKYIAIAQDITTRKLKEKKLQQAYTVFNNTRDGIVITDNKTNILDVNNAFERITGYTKREILDKQINVLKSNIYDEKFYKEMWNALDTIGFWEGEITNLTKNNDLYTEWLTINKICDNNKNVINYIGIFSDITEEKHKEALLKEKEALIFQQSKMASMGEMIENIAHQWRQPLSIISTAATGMLLQKEYGITISDEDEAKFLNSIDESAQYLSSTIDDFRDFIKKDQVLENFDLKDTVNSSIKLISSKLKNRDIKIVNTTQNIIIGGSRNQLVQVIINILNNSKDALEESDIANKYIFISTYGDDDNSILTIKDNAGGIPLKIIDRIFEPYFTTKHQAQGTGIGLYMSKQIITNSLKGVISVKNIEFEYENKNYTGALFEIKIPKNIIIKDK